MENDKNIMAVMGSGMSFQCKSMLLENYNQTESEVKFIVVDIEQEY